MWNDGMLKIYLTQQSADALSRVSELKPWPVHPTMVRGRTAVTKPYVKAAVRKPQIRKGKRKADDTQQLDKEVQELLPGSKKPRGKADEIVVEDLRDQDFRKTEKGRKAIMALMARLCESDAEKHEHSLLFGGDGKCRLNNESAKKVTRQQIIDSSPAALESMHLDTLMLIDCVEFKFNSCIL